MKIQMFHNFSCFVIAVVLASALTCHAIGTSPNLPTLQTVDSVDLSRYTGLWYELAHLPNKYQEGCQNSTTTFSQRNDGEIDILNSCRDKHDGSLHHANGRGWVIDKQHNARLKFSFIWPFRSEYLIIDQGKEYEYSVICSPDRKRLWVISRTPTVSSDILEGIIQNLEKQGFNRDNLVKTDHGGPPTPQVKLIENGTKNNSENK